MPKASWPRKVMVRAIAFAAASALGVVTVLAVSGFAIDGSKGPETEGAPVGRDGPVEVVKKPPPLPVFNPWLNDLGQFWVPEWDDRRLPEGADREQDPRWPAFAACLEARGQIDARGSDGRFTQSDMDGLIFELNTNYPDGARNKRRAIEEFSGVAADFLACANEELTKPVTR